MMTAMQNELLKRLGFRPGPQDRYGYWSADKRPLLSAYNCLRDSIDTSIDTREEISDIVECTEQQVAGGKDLHDVLECIYDILEGTTCSHDFGIYFYDDEDQCWARPPNTFMDYAFSTVIFGVENWGTFAVVVPEERPSAATVLPILWARWCMLVAPHYNISVVCADDHGHTWRYLRECGRFYWEMEVGTSLPPLLQPDGTAADVHCPVCGGDLLIFPDRYPAIEEAKQK